MGLAEEGSERARSAEDQANERPQTLTDGRTDGRAAPEAMPFQPCLVRKGGTMRDVAGVVSYMRHISDAISVFFSAEQAE